MGQALVSFFAASQAKQMKILPSFWSWAVPLKFRVNFKKSFCFVLFLVEVLGCHTRHTVV